MGMLDLINSADVTTKGVGSFFSNSDTEFKDSVKATFESLSSTHQYNPIQDFQKIMNSDIAFENYKALLFEDVLTESDSNASGIVTESYGSVSSRCEDQLTQQYIDLHGKKLEQTLENTREILKEASNVGQLEPIVALTLPLMKKAYIKTAYKDALQNIVADKPIVNIGYEREFLKNRAGDKFYLPDLFYPENEEQMLLAMSGTIGKPIASDFYPKAAGKTIPFQELNILEESGGSLQTRDALGYDFCIDSVKIKVPCETTVDASGFTEVTLQGLDIKPNLQTGQFSSKITSPSQKTGDKSVVTEYITGLVDFYAGKVSIMSSGGSITKVKFGGHLSSANNDVGMEADRERHNEQIAIPEQERLNTGLTVEKIRDEKILSNIDVTVDLVSRLSDSCQQFKDAKTKRFLELSYQEAKSGSVTAIAPMGYNIKFHEEVAFPLTPPGNYMLPESEWRTKQLRFYLENVITAMAQKLRVSDMMFVVTANPSMVKYLDDVKWVVDEQTKIGGVKLDYKFGVTTIGGTRVHVISTQKETFAKGLRIVAYPLTDTVITYRQYDYSFFIENNYRNVNTPLTPNIMVAQRYLNYKKLPVQAEFYFKEVRDGQTLGFVPLS